MINLIVVYLLALCGLCYSQNNKEALLGKEEVRGNEQWVEYRGMYIRHSTLEDFNKMRRAARWSFIKLDIVSAYRSFDRQNHIW